MPEAEPVAEARIDDAQWAELDAQLERDELSWLMADARGRHFMWRLLTKAGIYGTTFTGDALRSAFMEGQRNGGIVLLNLIAGTCPDRYLEMQKEARTYDRRNRKSRPGSTSASTSRSGRTDNSPR